MREYIGALSALRPTVNFANRMAAQPGQTWGPRAIPDHQLVYTLSGRAELVLGGATYALRAGDLACYGPNCPHRLTASATEPFAFSSVHFNWDAADPGPVHPGPRIRACSAAELGTAAPVAAVSLDGQSELPFPRHCSLPGLEPLLFQIVREYRAEEIGFQLVLRGLLLQLLTAVLRRSAARGPQEAEQKIAPALAAMREQPEREWTPGELAKLCGYHPTYFAQLFRTATGQAPKHFLLLERIRRAKALLREHMAIEHIAERLGYSGKHYFSRQFKSVTGLTPGEFRRHSREL